MNKATIIANNLDHLKTIVAREIDCFGLECDLNHIDVSRVNSLNSLFHYSPFNGDISKWDVSHVENMHWTFAVSKFNGDISNWNTSQVKEMGAMFYRSHFNQNISNWDVRNVEEMSAMFCKSQFNGDLESWRPYSLEDNVDMFNSAPCSEPYWSFYNNAQERKEAIDNYLIKKELTNNLKSSLSMKDPQVKKIKI
jgi:surface protein